MMIEQELQENGIVIPRQTMANWMMGLSQKYLQPLWDRLREELKSDVLQADDCAKDPGEVIVKRCFLLLPEQ